ncbi:MAG TPA: hypothetical protein VI197_20955, partial [Polyangiaceae bacterium]
SVAELNDCIVEQRQNVERIAALRSCEDARESGASRSEWFDDAAACQQLFDRCPGTFDEPSEPDEPDEPDDVDNVDEPVSPDDASYVIEGTVDGEAVEIRPSGSLGHTSSTSGDFWSLGLEFGGAELWIWGENEAAQGLLRMPPGGTEASSMLCLEAVEVVKSAETSTWESSNLSALPLCSEGDRQPLELSFAPGLAVQGTFQGETLAWVSQGYDCFETCRFKFEPSDDPGSGRDRWILEVDTTIETGVTKEFEHATLIHVGGAGGVACGGGGVVSYAENGELQIVVDALAPLSECPGTPVEGNLSGSF